MDITPVGGYSLLEFGDGFLHGLQKFENETSKCSRDIYKVKNIYNQLLEIIQDIQDGKFDASKVMFLAYQAYNTYIAIEDTCHFVELAANIASLFHPVTLVVRIIYLLIFDIWFIVPDFFRIITGLIFADSYKAGLNLGRIVKTVLTYEIE